jgi:hypothetical protein
MARAKRPPQPVREDRDERTRLEERFRVYVLKPGRHDTGMYIEAEDATLVCVASTGKGLETCLLTLRDESQITHNSIVGIKDDLERRWLVNPFGKGDE